MRRVRGFRSLLERRLSRREAIAGGSLVAGSLLVNGVSAQVSGSHPPLPRVAGSREDRVRVPSGYSAQVVLRWGDALFADAPAFDAEGLAVGALLAPGAAAAQSRQFGNNCDGIGFIATGERRAVLCVNHEYVIPELMFPGWAEARRNREMGAYVRRHPESVRVMQAAVGLSIVELEHAETWRAVLDSPVNRRVTADTEIVFSGPASAHPWLVSETRDGAALGFGTFGNCAAGTTPWGTYLTAEENVDDFFGNGGGADFAPDVMAAHRRFGLRFRESVPRWEYADRRFDMAVHPTESFKFGWIVEIDPRDPSAPIKKRTALGRLKHEGATTVIAKDGRAVTYTGDDEIFEYLYKFVSRDRFDPERPQRNRDLLDTGTLHVAKFFEDGRGEWVPLVHGQSAELTADRGFRSQADVVIRCREAADLVGATPLDRPEDVAVNPLNMRVYFACTQNSERGQPAEGGRAAAVTASSPRGPNERGHILEIIERDDDPAAVAFRWDVFLLAGDPVEGGLRAAPPTGEHPSVGADETYFAGQTDASQLSPFANPDNLGFDRYGNLWIVTDGDQPGGNNDGCFVCPTEGPDRGAVRQFMSGPVGAEICGCEFAPDGESLFLTVQHPGSGSTIESPSSRWPDGGAAGPRSSVIAIEPTTPGVTFGA